MGLYALVALKGFKVKDLCRSGKIALVAITALLLNGLPALAHHPLGGKTPGNFIEGFLSGIGHPVIGLDHLVFVIASGLLAAAIGRNLIIPVAFVLASLLGTGIHLVSIDLPLPELVISASVLVFGVLLALKKRPNSTIITGLAAISGLFHGFAYGESIFGAEMGPLMAYLLGFALIQLAIATAAYGMGSRLFQQSPESSALRFAGFIICGVGGTFLSTLMMDYVLLA
ncbi:HupE/UreJ family protein [Leptothoe sp. EHU-05/26/07-4]